MKEKGILLYNRLNRGYICECIVEMVVKGMLVDTNSCPALQKAPGVVMIVIADLGETRLCYKGTCNVQTGER